MIKVDGTNSKLIFLAGTANSTTLTSSLTATPWTLTLPPTAGTAGQVLTTDGNGVLSWATGGGGGAITVADDTTTNATRYPLFADITSGSLATAYVSSTEYSYNPSTGVLSARQMESTQGIFLNANTITANYTVPANTNGLSAGPMNVPAGITVNLGPGANWVIV
jgi:hypothetical protein